MKSTKGNRLRNGREREGCSSTMKSGPRNRLQLAAVNKASKVKQLKTINKQSNNRNMAGARNNSREIKNHVVDARFKLVQKSLEKLIDARQKLTKQRDAREIIQGRHLQYHNPIYNASRPNSSNLGQVQIDHHGVLTIQSILDERAISHNTNLYDKRPALNEERFISVERRCSSYTSNSDLNKFRSDCLIGDIRLTKRDAKVSRRPISNIQSRVNKKPKNRSMSMDYMNSMESEEINRFSPAPIIRHKTKNGMFHHYDRYQDDKFGRNSQNHRGLSRTSNTRLDSHQSSLVKQPQRQGFKIIISNLDQCVTTEDIKELFTDMGVLLEYGVVRPGVAEVIYERRADAIHAVDTYHNRQLDGKPMKCNMISKAVILGSKFETSHKIASHVVKIFKPSTHVTYNIDAIYAALFN